jgi:hypothetical protein
MAEEFWQAEELKDVKNLLFLTKKAESDKNIMSNLV